MSGFCTVTKAVNGQDALDQFAASAPGTFDAIIMDVMMPVMDGYQATRAIRQLDRPDAGSIPILAMTANAFVEDRRRAYEAGMNEHLTKPLEPEVVLRTLAKYRSITSTLFPSLTIPTPRFTVVVVLDTPPF